MTFVLGLVEDICLPCTELFFDLCFRLTQVVNLLELLK